MRGLILIELSLRKKIAIKRENTKKPFQDRIIEVIDTSPTGEVLLDEALRYMKNEQDSVANWIDYLSGTFGTLLNFR